MKNVNTHLLLILLATLFCTSQLQSQQRGSCGTIHSDLYEIDQQVAAYKKTDLWASRAFPEMPIRIPVKFHVVYHNGNDPITEVSCLKQLCRLNADYATAGFQFYLNDGIDEGIVFIDDQTINLLPTSPVGRSKIRNIANENRDAVNIFIVDDANTGSAGVTLGFYNRPDDYIVMKETEITAVTSSLTHELGHFLSLSHVFYGWESTDYNPAVPTPEFVFIGGSVSVRVEYFDRDKLLNGGKHCEESADRLCDTEADYNLGFGWSGCTYTGPAKDPDDEKLDPDEHNIMSYFINCNPYIFSADQADMMMMDYNTNPRRTTLMNDPNPPIFADITSAPTLISPENNADTKYFDEVVLEWSAVADASHYLLEFSFTNVFSGGAFSYIVQGTSFTVEDLAPNRTYYWRVTPLNAGGSCGESSASRRFKTSRTMTATVDALKEVNNWSIFPNPVTSSDNVNFTFNVNQAVNMELSMTTITGQEVMSQSLALQKGQRRVKLNTTELPNGIYMVTINNGINQTSKRLVIAK